MIKSTDITEFLNHCLLKTLYMVESPAKFFLSENQMCHNFNQFFQSVKFSNWKLIRKYFKVSEKQAKW